MFCRLALNGTPNEIWTRVSTLRKLRPRPLDDGSIEFGEPDGTRTRTDLIESQGAFSVLHTGSWKDWQQKSKDGVEIGLKGWVW